MLWSVVLTYPSETNKNLNVYYTDFRQNFVRYVWTFAFWFCKLTFNFPCHVACHDSMRLYRSVLTLLNCRMDAHRNSRPKYRWDVVWNDVFLKNDFCFVETNNHKDTLHATEMCIKSHGATISCSNSLEIQKL